MIKVNSLGKDFGKLTALQDVSFEAAPGEICGVLGPNGAGKSTLFKILCGLLEPTRGIFVLPEKKGKKIGAIIEGPKLYQYLSAADNIRLFGGLQGLNPSKSDIYQMLEKVGLPTNRKDMVSHFSVGMKQRLALAIALLNEPAVLILDEPFSGLDPLGMESFRALILELAKSHGITILLSSHILNELERLCNSLLVLNNGKVVARGSLDTLLFHTSTRYLVKGSGLQSSSLLHQLGANIEDDQAIVDLNPNDIKETMQKLWEDGATITSIAPVDKIERFYKTNLS